MRTRARIGFILLALIIAGGLALGFMPRAVPVETVTTAKGPLQVTVEEEGKTRVRERYVISAPVAGHARRIELKVGDAVKAGQTVIITEHGRPIGRIVPEPESKEERIQRLVESGELLWNGETLQPFEPVGDNTGGRLISDIISDLRE